MIPTLVFDIETIPDTDGLKGLLGLPAETSADDVAKIAFHQRRQHNGSEFCHCINIKWWPFLACCVKAIASRFGL